MPTVLPKVRGDPPSEEDELPEHPVRTARDSTTKAAIPIMFFALFMSIPL
jgi:hypothetical protein